jgi:hypothetical protein
MLATLWQEAFCLKYCTFTIKSTWGVTRDPFHVFDISVECLAERDMSENFGNRAKLCGEGQEFI